MTAFVARECVAKDGRAFVVRGAVESDAEAMLGYRVMETGTHQFGVTMPDEIDRDPEKQREWIREHAGGGCSVCLVAVAGEEMIGVLDVRAPKRRVLQHRVMLGMSVAEGWRGLGVGRALLNAVLDWARGHPVVEIIGLGCYATNERAQRLYRSVGFEVEGRRREFFRVGPGEYVDDVMMSIRVKDPPE